MATATNLQPILDGLQSQLALTFTASDSIDTKALAILGFDAAISIFGLQSEMGNQWWLLVALFASLVASACFTIRIIWPSNYAGAIVNINDHPEYLTLPEDQLLLQLIANTQKAITLNSAENSYKFRLCSIAIALSFSSIALLIGCIL